MESNKNNENTTSVNNPNEKVANIESKSITIPPKTNKEIKNYESELTIVPSYTNIEVCFHKDTVEQSRPSDNSEMTYFDILYRKTIGAIFGENQGKDLEEQDDDDDDEDEDEDEEEQPQPAAESSCRESPLSVIGIDGRELSDSTKSSKRRTRTVEKKLVEHDLAQKNDVSDEDHDVIFKKTIWTSRGQNQRRRAATRTPSRERPGAYSIENCRERSDVTIDMGPPPPDLDIPPDAEELQVKNTKVEAHKVDEDIEQAQLKELMQLREFKSKIESEKNAKVVYMVDKDAEQAQQDELLQLRQFKAKIAKEKRANILCWRFIIVVVVIGSSLVLLFLHI